MSEAAARRPVAPVLATAALLCAGSLALFWPGFAVYDSVAQYRQALSGAYDDWHPPAMARAWAGLHRLAGGGAGPMLAAQMGLYWLGLGLLAAALARTGRRRAASAVLAVGIWPPFLGWQAAVLKDAQMTGAMLAAVGLVGWWRLAGRRMPAIALAGVAVLLAYAVLVRANAVFAVVPLAAMLLPGRHPAARAIAAVAGVGMVLALLGPVNHDLMGAHRSGVERTEALYDLAGVAVRAPDAADLPLDRAAIATMIERRCVKPFFWDPLGEPERCGVVIEPWRQVAPSALYAMLARVVLAHPIAYAQHRLAHLNSTDRWLVPADWPGAAPPAAGERNDLGLVEPGRAAVRFDLVAGRLAETPFAWPAAWIVVVATILLVAARRPAAPARDLALALAVSALALEGSFALLSIASDLRYHLWPMIAAALAAVLLADRIGPAERPVLARGGGVLAAVIAAGLIARFILPAVPASYAGMLAS